MVTDNYPDDGRQQLIRWWLDHIDRLDIDNHNRCLPWFAYFNRLEDLQRLCRMDNMDLNIPNQYGDTALIVASREGHTSIVDELLTYYPHRLTATHLNHQNKYGDTALHWACAKNHLDIVRSLCRVQDTDLSLPDLNDDTALIIAAARGHTSVVDELLTYYPHRLTDLNHQDNFGRTALYLACANNHLAIIRSLCRLPEVDLSLENKNGDTALIVASREGHTSIVDELLTYYPHRLTATHLNHQDTIGDTALLWACFSNHLDIVRSLCRIADVDLNIPNQYGNTPLIAAVYKGCTSIVEELLTYYPHRLTNLNHQDKYGRTALYKTYCYNHPDIVRSLCRIPDVDLNVPDVYGDTPLIKATDSGNTSIVEELLTYYPLRLTATHLNHQNKDGDTALHWACANNLLDIVRSLCRIPDVDLNIPDQDGDTALIIAAARGRTSIVDELLTYYPHRLTAANLNHRNKKSETALSIARRKGYTQITETLRNHGALDY